jgi:hypothetical protein
MKSRGSETKCRGRNMKPWDSVTTTTLMPSPNNSLSFRLVNYFIRYRAYQYLQNLLHYNMYSKWHNNKEFSCRCCNIPTTTSLRTASTSSGTFHIIRLSVSLFLFIFLLFFNWCSIFVHPAPVTRSWTRSMARPEIVVDTPTSHTTTVIPTTRLDLFFFYLVVNYLMWWIIIWCLLFWCILCEFVSEVVVILFLKNKKLITSVELTIADESYSSNFRRLWGRRKLSFPE